MGHESYKIMCGNPRFHHYCKRGQLPNNLLFGFENEIVHNPDWDLTTPQLDKHFLQFMEKYPFLYAKEEHSNEGMELNSHPMNWNFFSKNINFVSELKNLKHRYFYTNKYCGFHIHISRKFFKKNHLVNMARFFYDAENTRFLQRISRRKKPQFYEWASTDFPGGQNDGSFSFFKGLVEDFPLNEKACALNLYSRNTIEIRMFRGTLNPMLFQAYMQFALAVTLFTKDIHIADVTLTNFRKFVKDNIRKYSFEALHRLITRPESFNP